MRVLALVSALLAPARAQTPAVPDLPSLGAAFATGPKLNFSGRLALYAGQYYFESDRGSVNGYGDLHLQLSRSYSPSFGVFGDVRATYTGFKQVDELAGGGTLFQQSMDGSASIKWIKRIEGGKSFKPRLGAKYELFRETSDEKWGEGLYDFWRGEAGVGWEKKSRLGASTAMTSNLAYDLYYTHYPNYVSLGSEFGTEVGAQDPGKRVLDSFSHQFTWRADLSFPGAIGGWLLASASVIEYPQQKVVDSAGKYQNFNRTDLAGSLGVGASKRLGDLQLLGRIRPWLGLGLTASRVESDQNHYDPDPARLKFIANYYTYNEARAEPSLTLQLLASGVTLDVGYEFAWRAYPDRLTQDSNGLYETKKLQQTSHSVSAGLGWAVFRDFELKLKGTYSQASSNMSYEQTYRYNYESSNVYGGIEWRL